MNRSTRLKQGHERVKAGSTGRSVHTLGTELNSDLRKPQFVSAQFRQLPGGGTARPAGSTVGGRTASAAADMSLGS